MILQECHFHLNPPFTVEVPSSKLTSLAGKSPILNRRYIFIHGLFRVFHCHLLVLPENLHLDHWNKIGSAKASTNSSEAAAFLELARGAPVTAEFPQQVDHGIASCSGWQWQGSAKLKFAMTLGKHVYVYIYIMIYLIEVNNFKKMTCVDLMNLRCCFFTELFG